MNEAWTIGEKTVTAAPRVLVVEDEPNIRELVCLHLGLEGYACEGAGDGKAGLARIEAERFDLLVLDVMLPGLDGVSLCRAVRRGAMNGDVPILMLTARGEESDKVIGLESGADDYLTKPFGVRELVARARALLRRPRKSAGEAPLDESAEPRRGVRREHIVDPRDIGLVAQAGGMAEQEPRVELRRGNPCLAQKPRRGSMRLTEAEARGYELTHGLLPGRRRAGSSDAR
jgi:DNA-binding response OmpR family regulator